MFVEASRGARLLTPRLWIPLEEIKKIYFLFFAIAWKLGVDFRHLTRNASRVRRKVGSGES